MTTHFTSLQTQRESPKEFVPVEGGSDTTSAEMLLVVAYVAMWLLFFAFIWLTHRRQRGLNAKLSELERALQRADAAGGSKSA